MTEHTFKFTEGQYPTFECDFDMPAALYDELREVVKEFYKRSNMERVKKGEEYWFIDRDGETLWRYEAYSCQDDMMFDCNNYFHTKEEAESMARKLRAVLKGADVIEMPNEEEIEKEAVNIAMNICGDDYWRDCEEAVHKTINYLKSKIVK